MPSSQAFLDWQAAEALAAAATAAYHQTVDAGRTPTDNEVAQLEKLRSDARAKLRLMVEDMKSETM
jgi:hypothetical protein